MLRAGYAKIYFSTSTLLYLIYRIILIFFFEISSLAVCFRYVPEVTIKLKMRIPVLTDVVLNVRVTIMNSNVTLISMVVLCANVNQDGTGTRAKHEAKNQIEVSERVLKRVFILQAGR